MSSLQEILLLITVPTIAICVSLALTLLIEWRTRRKRQQIESMMGSMQADLKNVAEQVGSMLDRENDPKAAFVVSTVDVERKLRELAVVVTGSKVARPVLGIVDTMIKDGVLQQNWKTSFWTLWTIRNKVIHGVGVTDNEIKYGTELAASLTLDLRRIETERKLLLPLSKFEIYKDPAGRFYWRLKAPNGEIIAVSEAYESKAGCIKGIESVRKGSSDALIQEIRD